LQAISQPVAARRQRIAILAVVVVIFRVPAARAHALDELGRDTVAFDEQRVVGVAWTRKADQIAGEAKLDGIYVIRTAVPAEDISAENAVQAYKDLSRVERAFRSMKTFDLEIRPIRHWTADRVRAPVFLCMLACHVQWHLRQCASPVVKTEPSDTVKAKKATKRSADGDRVMGFDGLSAHLGTLTRNTMRVPSRPKHRFTLYAKPTPLQEAAFRLLDLDPARVQ
jgi:hypothetical protein